MRPIRKRSRESIREVIPLGNPDQYPRRKFMKLLPKVRSRAVLSKKRLLMYATT
ncbi:hypothetical protein TSAR_005460 [Trichomalopsis sarcophagae]|uniref:Uncharacterized protein n=1 Tax=Trichomalopsis sarcophagae TaxID=543379 RepID=A0A232ER43_9HYME|nr:hypothetical protein TSAR_005460 [Trichomalopsis sarcophagae]